MDWTQKPRLVKHGLDLKPETISKELCGEGGGDIRPIVKKAR